MTPANGTDIKRRLRRTRAWFKRTFPPGSRLVVGALLVVGGVFGFLPVLGFWMIPLGISVMLIDIGVARRRIARWRRQWQERKARRKDENTGSGGGGGAGGGDGRT